MSSRTISNVASELLPRNASRKSFVIQNEDPTDIAYVKLERSEFTTVSATDHDFRLGPGASLALNASTDGIQAIQSRITAIASANTPRLSFFETEDQLR